MVSSPCRQNDGRPKRTVPMPFAAQGDAQGTSPQPAGDRGRYWGLMPAGFRVNADVQERGYGASSVVTEATGSVAVRRFAGAEAKT